MKQPVVFYSILFVSVLAAIVFISFFLEPVSPPQNIFLSNSSDHQVTVSWTTKIPTRGSIFAKGWHKDDGEKHVKTTGFYTTHHITVENLSPNASYSFRIYQGWRNVFTGSFKTTSSLKSISTPLPVYGRVLTDGKTPVVGAIVYLRVFSPDKKASALLSTLTNSDGRWSIDLANLRTQNLTTLFPLTSKSSQELIVDAGKKGRGRAQTTRGRDRPWPDIIL